jgi:hypothetical protein
MENLAMIADNPAALPAYSSIYAGTTDVNDIIRATSTSVWSRTALQHPLHYTSFFSTETADFMGSRAVKSNWTLDPTVVPEKLRAMRAACNWVLLGHEHVGPDVQYLLRYEPAEYKEEKLSNVTYQYLPDLNDVTGIPASGKNTIIVATVKTITAGGTPGPHMLYIHMFDKHGYKFLSVNENQLRLGPMEIQKLKLILAQYGNDPPFDTVRSIAMFVKSLLDDKCIGEAIDELFNPNSVVLVINKPGSPDGYYFDVADNLARIGTTWLHVETRLYDVPKNACYKACCGNKAVWVGPQDMGKLSDFLLILQKIARTDFGSAYYPRPQTRAIQKNFAFNMFGENYYGSATLNVDQNGFLTPGSGQPALPLKARTDNVGLNADLRSVINAAAKSSSP